MASSSSAPSGSSKSPRSPADRMSGRPEAAWSTSSNYSRTSSTRTERSLDDEEEEDRNLAYGNTQAIAGPSASPYDPRRPRPIASPLSPGPGSMAQWQAVPPPSNAMAPYPYDNRIQSAPVVGQNQALYQNTYAPAPHISNRDTGNTNTNQVTDAYNDKSYHKVEVKNMTIHHHYHAPQSAPPTCKSSPPISASASGSSAPSAYPSAPKESRRRSRSKTREVEYFPLQNDIPVYESAPAMQREQSDSTPVPYPNLRQPSGQKNPPVAKSTGRTTHRGRDKQRDDPFPQSGTYGGASSEIVRPERMQPQHSRSESVNILNSEMAALSVNRGKAKQADGLNLIIAANQMDTASSSTSGKAKWYPDVKLLDPPPPPPPKDIEYIERLQASAAPGSKEVATVASSSRDASVPTTPLGDPIGYPSLKEFTGVSGGQWILHEGIEDHIPAYMSLRLYGIDKKTIPLWQPQPFLTSNNGKKKGVDVGDIVYLSDSGKIHVVFNIFRSFKENCNDGAHPLPEQYHGHINIGSLGQKPSQEEIQNRKCYFSDNVVLLGINEGSERYRFEAKKGVKREGIVVLPQGGIKAVIPKGFFDEDAVKEFFCRYSPSWYHHIRRIRPRIRNGDLFLVSQAYRADALGIAALTMEKPAKRPLVIEFAYDHQASKYYWTSRDSWWMSSVSSPRPARTESDSGSTDMQHCIGVSLYSILLDEKTWSMHFDPKPSPVSESRNQSAASFPQKPPTDSATRKSDSSPSGLGSTFSKLSPKFWIGRKSDKHSDNGETGSIQQLPPAGEDRFYAYNLLWSNPDPRA